MSIEQITLSFDDNKNCLDQLINAGAEEIYRISKLKHERSLLDSLKQSMFNKAARRLSTDDTIYFQ